MGKHERDFIPFGACVNEAASTFDTASPEDHYSAQQACMGCPQLPHCQAQGPAIANALAIRGVHPQVVGGTIYNILPDEVAAIPYMELGEPTFTMKFQPLPTDGLRSVRAIQQALRSGQLASTSHLARPKPELSTDYLHTLASQPEVYAFAEQHPEVIETIVDLILQSCVRRYAKNGRAYNKGRFNDFVFDDHIETVGSFVAEAMQINALGISGKRAKYHSAVFYETYMQKGLELGITQHMLARVAEASSANLLDAARQTAQRKASSNITKQWAVQYARDAAEIQDMYTGKAAQYAAALVEYGVLAVDDQGDLAISEEYAYLSPQEISAIYYSYGLDAFVDPPAFYDETVNDIPDIQHFTRKVLLPFLDPEQLAASRDPEALATDPELLMTSIRRDLWLGKVSNKAGRNAAHRNLDSMIIALAREAAIVPKELGNANYVQAMGWLYTAYDKFSRLYGLEVNNQTFVRLTELLHADYVQMGRPKDKRALVGCLAFGAAVCRDMTAYLMSKGIPEQIALGSIVSRHHPLRAALNYRNRYWYLQVRLANTTARPSDIESFARRGMDEARAKATLVRIEQSKKEFGNIFTKGTIHDLYMHRLRVDDAVLEDKAVAVKAFKEQNTYDMRVTLPLSRKASALVLRCEPGAEAEALRTHFQIRPQTPEPMPTLRSDFIFMGKCLEQPELFDTNNSMLDETAVNLCRSCIQLPFCSRQSNPIATLIASRGISRQIVGGEIMTLRPGVTYIGHILEHGETSFEFNVRPLPTYGVRGLRALQQARRSGHMYHRPISRHPFSDITRRYMDYLMRDSRLHAFASGHPEVLDVISNAIISAAAKPLPRGGRAKPEERFAGFDPMDYVGVMWEFIQEAQQIKNMGLPPDRAIYHSPSFYVSYFKEGRRQGVPDYILRSKASNRVHAVLEAAQKEKAQKAARSRSVAGKRQKRLQYKAQDTDTGEEAKIARVVLRLCKYGVLSVDDNLAVTDSSMVLDFDPIERAAIGSAYGLGDAIPSDIGPDELLRHITDPWDTTNTVLLPHLHPALFEAERRQLYVKDPKVMFKLFQRDAWAGKIEPTDYSKQHLLIAKLAIDLDGDMPSAAIRNDKIWGQTLMDLYSYTRNRMAWHFADIARLYCSAATQYEEWKQPRPGTVARLYAPDVYQRLTSYAADKGVSPGDIRRAFASSRNPIPLLSKLVARRREISIAVGRYSLPNTAINRLADNNVGAEGAVEIAESIVRYQRQYAAIFAPGVVTDFCTNNVKTAPARIELIAQAVLRFWEANPAYSGQRLPARVAMKALRSRDGAAKAIRQYYTNARL